MHRKVHATPNFYAVLAGCCAGAFSAICVCLTFFSFYLLRHHQQGVVQGIFSPRASIPVSAPLVVHPQDEALGGQREQSPFLVRSYPMSFAPLVRAVIPAVVNISVASPNDAEEEDDDEESAAPGVPAEAVTLPGPPKNRRASGGSREGRKQANVLGRPPAHRIPPRPGRSAGKNSRTGRETGGRAGVVRPVSLAVADSGKKDDGEMGSGFLIDSRGVIVTNAHVVGDGRGVSVALSDGRVLPATLVGSDPVTDVAVISVSSATPLPCVRWSSRQVEIGDWILAAGNPFGFGSSVSAGIVSAIGRDLGIGPLDNYIQLDAPINPGNSGGPAFNMRGEVVAMNAAIASPGDGSVGIGFGIPTELVAPVVDEILKTGHVDHGWVGITLDDTSLPIKVTSVDAGGPAWTGGLRPGDELLQMDGSSVPSARAVLRSIGISKPGSVFGFTIRRNGVQKFLSLQLGKRPRGKQAFAQQPN